MKTVSQLSPERKTPSLAELTALRSNEGGLKPFDDRTVAFFDQLSKAILKSQSLNHVGEIAALAFWLRAANLRQYITENAHLKHTSAKGLIFHVCPSNVETMFMYSLAVALLMGNRNVIRLSNRVRSQEQEILLDVLNAELMKNENQVFQDHINIITYGHDEAINKEL